MSYFNFLQIYYLNLSFFVLTDLSIANTFAPLPVEFVWNPTVFLPFHANAVTFEALGPNYFFSDVWKSAYSVGGGTIVDDHHIAETKLIYPDTGMDNILKWFYQSGKSIWEYALEYESPDLWDYLDEVWKVMQEAILRGLEIEGPLPGELHYPRKASAYYVKARNLKSSMKKRAMVYAYALAVSEENASGGKDSYSSYMWRLWHHAVSIILYEEIPETI